ncbi:MAG TPA: hypothetical protein O0X97_06025 [Methanocorpusculum sp.]|nr:hypothetical protein [Methanocorpusculum sp.]
MIQDIHAHTYYSNCGRDKPEDVLEAVISGGVTQFGFCDHNYGITSLREKTGCSRALGIYRDHMALLQEKYVGRLRLFSGIELATNSPLTCLPEGTTLERFDYCLIEHIDTPTPCASDLFSYAESLRCPRVGIAHTDLPGWLEAAGQDLSGYFRRMAEHGIFWEMNVNFDSIHGFREHPYVARFFADERLQGTVRESGLCLSVGFDGHRLEDYRPERVADCCARIEELGIPLVFAEKK